MKRFNYENENYLKKLDELPSSYYSKYRLFISKYLKNKKLSFLDIGCGNGINLQKLAEEGYENGKGLEISNHFVKEAKKRGVKNVYLYDGKKFPFKPSSFSLVGSFNVLEHVEDPNLFLSSQVRIVKKNGFIIVACPNFLSILFRNPHRRLKGFRNKLRNFYLIISKLINSNSEFEMMPPVIKDDFEYDDDAIVVTNLIDLKRVLQKNNCRVVYESGFINYDSAIYQLINKVPFLKYLMPSCFVVAQKQK